MEVGKLETGSTSGAAGTPKGGQIFYFILDEDYPDEPRDGHQRYFYVVSATSSYIDAYCFLCHSLCRRGQRSAAATPPGSLFSSGRTPPGRDQHLHAQPHASASGSGSVNASLDEAPELDTNSTKLRQWYQLYVRVFGATSYDAFVRQVRAAPVGVVGPTRAESQGSLSLPRLFTDENAARTALECYQRAVQAGSPAGLPSAAALTARQQTSCTPEKQSTPKTHARAPVASARPSTAPGNTFSRFQQHQEAQTQRPAPPAPKLSPQAMSVVGLQPPTKATESHAIHDPLAAQRRLHVAPADSASTPTRVGQGPSRLPVAAQPLHGEPKKETGVEDLRRRLEEVQRGAERETNRLRQDIMDLKRKLFEERESHDGLLREALEKERTTLRAENEALAQAEVAHIKTKLKFAEQARGELEALLAKERETHRGQQEAWRKEVAALQEQLQQQSREHGARLHAVVKENQVAVEKLESQGMAKETELKTLYEEALQKRDVRIAQLSEQLMKSEQGARQSQSEVVAARARCEELESQVARLRRQLDERQDDSPGPSHVRHGSQGPRGAGWDREYALMEWNASLQRELSLAHRELADAHRRQQSLDSYRQPSSPSPSHYHDPVFSQQYQRLEAAHTSLLQEKKSLEMALNTAQEENTKLQTELARAGHLIQALKEGLETVQNELPVLRRELYPALQ